MKTVVYGNRGSGFEAVINYINQIYENRKLAVINKRSTPVKVTRSKGTKVLAGFYEAKSTVDYDGIYRGRAIFFEAKSTQELDRFDLKRVEDHQYEHLEKCHAVGAVCFVLVEFRRQRKTYLLPFATLRAYKGEATRGGRKSMTIDNFEVDAYEVMQGRVQLDYLATVDKIWFTETA
ncbi:Holliday junction resolvase RecU [Paenibacillus wynnii]|uniref:Holliday junction resolvase RecU n=1 Tax=Paenibacillus wynnii TaxID=268407 RepID=A0A098M7G2_9BACL|nr:Holliday junction resolvase RecU [Paenibacillus wynnii]KGE18475.1 recombinase RecU [Paenibacillus wynnii]KGE20590.1 recombinase RecU [Paenibacillus wynnii]